MTDIIKYLAAGIATYFIVDMIRKRRDSGKPLFTTQSVGMAPGVVKPTIGETPAQYGSQTPGGQTIVSPTGQVRPVLSQQLQPGIMNGYFTPNWEWV